MTRRRGSGALALTTGVFIVTLAARLFTAARLPTEWDSVQFVLGVSHFDVRQDSPNAPGYWAYIAAARIVRWLTPLGAHASLIVVTAIASALTGVLLSLIGTRCAHVWFGLAAATLWLTNPFSWFYGSIVNVKVFDSLAIVAVLLCALHARPGGRAHVAAAAIVGVAAGFRPTSALVVAAVAAFTFIKCARSVRGVIEAAVAGVAGLAVWLIPVSVEQPGGLRTLRAVNSFMFSITAKQTSILYGAPHVAARDNVARATAAAVVSVVPALMVSALGVVVILVNRRRVAGSLIATSTVALFAAAAVPGFLVVALIHFGTPGFTLSFLPAALLLALVPAAALRGRWATVVLVAAALVGAQRFLAGTSVVPRSVSTNRYLPDAVTLHEIRHEDARSRAVRRAVRRLRSDRDVAVFLLGDPGEMFRSASLLTEAYMEHLVAADTDVESAYRGLTWFDDDDAIEVPPDGDAVLLAGQDALVTDAANHPIAAQQISRVYRAYVVPPGGHIGGVRVVASPYALRVVRRPERLRPCGGNANC